ncbi:GNAT family N-acetyltransferase [Bacillus hwajinpoensis]|uniref:GNAT family N-acetyltransferase n=2 Tax=Guptibacillus hwajinpoensis TaxID=208199 RepID=A0A845F298_9BACL|nr:GNAT family N-acetyltransferase [Pseudalkalibacillus hwajinpoensis]
MKRRESLKALMKLIPSLWGTARITIQDLRKSEILPVQKIYEQGSYLHEWDGGSGDQDYAYRCFTDGDLPPNGSKEQYKIQVLRLKETDTIVGILTTYHGYPKSETFYINYLYIDKRYHKQGFGKEVISELLHLLKDAEFEEVRANVAIKNWPALRFWTGLGLNTINGFYGDKEYRANHYADIELMMKF